MVFCPNKCFYSRGAACFYAWNFGLYLLSPARDKVPQEPNSAWERMSTSWWAQRASCSGRALAGIPCWPSRISKSIVCALCLAKRAADTPPHSSFGSFHGWTEYLNTLFLDYKLYRMGSGPYLDFYSSYTVNSTKNKWWWQMFPKPEFNLPMFIHNLKLCHLQD